MADIALTQKGSYYDFSFQDGDFVLTQGMDTALLMSIFCEKRADISEMPFVETRRGWWGNTVLDTDNYEIGSKLWLLEQARRDLTSLSLAKTYTQDCLQWLLEDDLAKEVKTDSAFSSNGIDIDVNIVTTSNKVLSKAYNLWNNTG